MTRRSDLDLAREIEKIADALDWATKHFVNQAQADAASHMAATVRPNPLTVIVGQAREDAHRLVAELMEDAER